MTALLLLASLVSAPSPAGPAQEGETVTSVRIEAPGEYAVRFARYVEVKAGEPLRRATLRHVVEVLHATGAFEDVVVEARRSPVSEAGERAAGLEVVFRLIPAPLLAQVKVEGDLVLAPDALRRITQLGLREPLWTARAERAAQDAALHLARNGYLEARVTSAVRPVAGGADLAFTVRAGPRARVSAATLEGIAGTGADRLRPLLRPRPGEVYRREHAREAAERVRKRLVAERRWRASVEVRESYDPSTARLALAFVVQPGPLTSVEFRGDRLPSGLRTTVADILREGGLKGDVLEEATERIEEELRARGHRDALVAHREEVLAGGEVVRFDVDAGPAARVASVGILGAPDALATRLATRAGDPLEDRLLQEDARALQRALEEDGHADAKIEVEAPEGGGLVPVQFRLRPGPRTLIRSFTVEAPPLEGDAAPRELRQREGRPYRVRDLALDRNDLLASCKNAGFLQAEVVPEVRFSEDRAGAAVTLRVVPGPRTEVDHIVISGLEHTREDVVRRELLVREGEPLGLQRVLESQRRLGSLGIFQRVTIAEMDPESTDRRSVVVSAEEGPRTTVAYGIGYAERDLLRASAEVTRRNLSGLDRSLSTFVRASFRGSRFLTTYREPYLLGRKQDLYLTGFREEEDRESFDFTRYGGLVQTARNLAPRWSLILRYAFQQTSVFNIAVPLDEVDRQFRSSTISGPSASAIKDTRDDPLDPRRGHFLGADVQLSTRLLGGDSFVKGFLQAAAYRRLERRVTLALSGRVGLARTLGVGAPLRLPLPDRFFAGGDYSLRGFKLDTAGPLERGDSGELFPTGGNALLLGGAELRVDAGRFFSIAAFTDAGNVYRLVSDADFGDIRYAAGMGLRYKSALGPLRVDWALKLNRRQGESPSHLHVTIGHAF